MSTESHTPSIDVVYYNLAEIIKNDDKRPADRVGSLIVDCTLPLYNIESLYIDYPILEEIAEIGADMEWQGEAYFADYIKQLNEKIKALENSINKKSA